MKDFTKLSGFEIRTGSVIKLRNGNLHHVGEINIVGNEVEALGFVEDERGFVVELNKPIYYNILERVWVRNW